MRTRLRLLQRCRIAIAVCFFRLWRRLFGTSNACTFLRFFDREQTAEVLREGGARLGRSCDIESGITIHNAAVDFRNLSIDDESYIGKEVFLDLHDKIHLGRRVGIAARCTLLTHFEFARSPLGRIYPPASGPIHIGTGTVLGVGCIVLHGVTIGENTMVAAGAVVRDDIPSNCLAAGVPARVIRRLDI